MRIREPVPDDAEALGRVHVRAWQVAYRGMTPDDYLDELSIDDRAQLWRDGLARPRRARRTRLVFEDHGRAVGFVLAGPTDGDDDSAIGEVYALNVDPDAWGRGNGRALLSAAVDALASSSFRELVLWVHPDNHRARAFYERAGWECDGITPESGGPRHRGARSPLSAGRLTPPRPRSCRKYAATAALWGGVVCA